MSDLHFNHGGKTHSLRIRVVDDGEGFLVYEGLVDGRMYVFWEAAPGVDVWDLFKLAIEAYVEEIRDDSVERIG